jgi:hypothetical protein
MIVNKALVLVFWFLLPLLVQHGSEFVVVVAAVAAAPGSDRHRSLQRAPRRRLDYNTKGKQSSHSKTESQSDDNFDDAISKIEIKESTMSDDATGDDATGDDATGDDTTGEDALGKDKEDNHDDYVDNDDEDAEASGDDLHSKEVDVENANVTATSTSSSEPDSSLATTKPDEVVQDDLVVNSLMVEHAGNGDAAGNTTTDDSSAVNEQGSGTQDENVDSIDGEGGLSLNNSTQHETLDSGAPTPSALGNNSTTTTTSTTRTYSYPTASSTTESPVLDASVQSWPTPQSPYEDAPSPYGDPYHKATSTSSHTSASVYVPPAGVDPVSQQETAAQQWKKQDWANKTPKEIEEMAEAEVSKMLNDKYVPLVAVTMALVSFAFTLIVVQQIIENPNGCLTKLCKCTVGCFRIIIWPIAYLFCCCCSKGGFDSGRRAHDHRPLRADDECSTDLEFA